MRKRQKVRLIILILMFLLFPAIFFYMSPYLIIDASFKGIISGSFLLFVLQFLSSILVGRIYCGWVCPAAGIQEIIKDYNTKKVNVFNILKWIIWVPWIIAIILVAVKNGGYIKIEPGYQTEFGLSITNVYGLITYLSVLAIIVIPAFVIGKRSFCHHICWMAPFMIIGRTLRNLFHIPALQIVSDKSKCIHCHVCSEKCPMSLAVEKMADSGYIEHPECIQCYSCVDNCKQDVLRVKFQRKKNK